jgi:hypothetical protein
MEKLKKILSDRSFKIKPEDLEAKVRQFGYDPAKLSDADAQIVADELIKPVGAIATQPPKNPKPPAAGTNLEGLQRSMMEAWEKQDANLTAFTGRLQARKQTRIANWVDENFQIISSTSQDAVDALSRKLQEVESDPDTFLGLADQIPSHIPVVG